MDIVIKGRNVEVPEHYRVHVSEKLARLERYDRKVIRYDVELFHEPNRRQAKSCQRVEITGKGGGPLVRAEASAGDFYTALDAAMSKLENRLRRMHERRVQYGRRKAQPVSEAMAVPQARSAASARGGDRAAGIPSGTGTAVLESSAEPATEQAPADEVELPGQRWDDGEWDDGVQVHEPGRIVREKQHSAEPMTIDDALYQMELVGHDFYLFNDSDTGKPSVVYRRKGFDYGLIHLG